ncbi:MAG: MBL fold metallo-hydrolase, partial [Bacteriovoracales bacterium]|nr:MBL fold metallo-hydrolase [Bacteriovoracales bacterium]
MLFRQLFDRESCTYTYLLADGKTLEAVLIDSVFEHADRDLSLIEELGLKVKYVLETHVHADHITGAKKIKDVTGALFALNKISGHKQADILLGDGDILKFGGYDLQVLFTPGHTETCTTYACEERLFTGDALFIRGCGRTDFQGGSPETLYRSVHERIYSRPDHKKIYPGHDYKGRTVSTVGEEKRFNPRLKLTNSLQ